MTTIPPSPFPSTLIDVEAAMDAIERSIPDHSVDDVFASFMSSSTVHPSMRGFLNVSDPQEMDSDTAALSPAEPSSPVSLPPLSPAPSTDSADLSSAPNSPSSSSTPFSLASPKRRSSTVGVRKAAPTKRSRSPSMSSDNDSSEASTPAEASLDPIAQKKERRKQQNRAAAATSRRKRQRMITEMEQKIEELIAKQRLLTESVQTLTSQNADLKAKLQAKIRVGAAQPPQAVEAVAVKVEAEDQTAVVAVKAEQRVEGEHVSQDRVSNLYPPALSGVAVEDTQRGIDLDVHTHCPPPPLLPPQPLLTSDPPHSTHLLDFLDMDHPSFGVRQATFHVDDSYDFPAFTDNADQLWMDSLVA